MTSVRSRIGLPSVNPVHRRDARLSPVRIQTELSAPGSSSTNRNPRKGRKRPANGARGRRPPAKAAPRDPILILIHRIGHALAAAWMVVAGSAGFTARRFGNSARDLDPEHRRDGVGLLGPGIGIVLAASIWWRMDNPVGRAISAFMHGAAGPWPG